jgi:hypothetical protein
MPLAISNANDPGGQQTAAVGITAAFALLCFLLWRGVLTYVPDCLACGPPHFLSADCLACGPPPFLHGPSASVANSAGGFLIFLSRLEAQRLVPNPSGFF